VVTNGGFFGYDQAGNAIPLGLVVSAGKALNRRMPWSTGGFLVRDARGIGIVPVGTIGFEGAVQEALQSKPIVVEQGGNGIHNQDEALFDRVAVGLSADGMLVTAGVFGAEGQGGTLYEFGEALAQRVGHPAPGLLNALAMDGGPGAHIYVPSLKKHLGSGRRSCHGDRALASVWNTHGSGSLPSPLSARARSTRRCCQP
jgi:hypothetical protein